MGSTRRLIVAGLLFVIGFLVFHAIHQAYWTSTVEPVPVGSKPKTATFDCGSLYGKAEVKLTAGVIPPGSTVDGTPCGTRSSDRIMIGLDVILGVAGIAVVVAWPRHRPEREPV